MCSRTAPVRVTAQRATGVHPIMGLFKQMKQLKDMTVAAPGLLAQAQQTAAAAQAYGAQQQGAYGAVGGFGGGGLNPGDPRLAPIAGVDLVMYARVSKAASQEMLNADGLVLRAQSYGITAEAWHEAATGWPARMRNDMQLATHYGALFGQV